MPNFLYVNGRYQIKWDPSKTNGAPIELYLLQGKQIRYYREKRNTVLTNDFPSIEEHEFEWVTFYNGTGIVLNLKD